MNIVSNSMTKAPPILIKIIITCQLRYLQTLNNIAAENNSTVIFPVPVDVISQLMGKVSLRTMKFIVMMTFLILSCIHVQYSKKMYSTVPSKKNCYIYTMKAHPDLRNPTSTCKYWILSSSLCLSFSSLRES